MQAEDTEIRTEAHSRKRERPRALTICSASLVALLFFAGFFYKYFSTIQVSGQSMEPTFANGEKLLASRAYWLIGPIRDNDIVVISGEEPGEHIIKRVYRTEGEVVDWLNVPSDYDFSHGEYVVPDNHIYLLGDNREVSEDSRKFGAIPKERILGKIVLKKWL